jgi:small-conductance mechanosensitive channel
LKEPLPKDFPMPDATLTELNLLAQNVVNFIPRLFTAIIIYLVFWFVSLIFKGIVKRYGDRTRLNEDVRDLLARLIRLSILVIGIITALGTVGIDVTALVAGLGLTGFALGFALQDVISNVLAGVLILMNRPFRRGNYIRVGDKEGTVIDMDLRYTSLQKDNLKILIPNSSLFKEAITIVMPVGSAPSMPPTNAP